MKPDGPDWRVVAVTLSAILLFSACGGRRTGQSFFRRIIGKDGTVITVQVPEGEPASVGTYRVTAMSDKGPSQEFEVERNGTVVEAWLLDLNGDDLVELLVWTASAGSGSYGRIDLFMPEKGMFRRANVGALNADQRTGYMGHDVYRIVGERLIRAFPIYLDSDVNARPTGGIRQFVYEATENRWMEATEEKEVRRR